MYYIPLEVHLDWAFQIDYCDSLCEEQKALFDAEKPILGRFLQRQAVR